ncbi:MAG: DUF2779 domain-containing protein [Balneolaceae bacterium]
MLKALLRSAYPNGVPVDERSVLEASRKTNELLEKSEVVIFDAIFEYQQMMARLPVVVKSGNDLTVYHVRTKAFDSRKHRLSNAGRQIYSKWRRYLLDFAYELYLVKKNCPDVTLHPFLVMPEKTGKSHTDDLPFRLQPLENEPNIVSVSRTNQELLAKLEVGELIAKVWEDPSFARLHLPRDTFQESVYYFRSLYFNRTKANPKVGIKCKNCEFRVEKERVRSGTESGFIECWEGVMKREDILNSHVFDLIGPGSAKWMQHKIYNQREVLAEEIFAPEIILSGDGKLTQQMRQALQVYQARGENVPREIFRPQLFSELKRWEYPLHFLDFEAGNYAVPVRRNRKPYDLVVFQFSCHTLYEDGTWSHHQWIDNFDSGYVSYELVRQLMSVPDIDDGTIVQYSDFERNALKIIRRELINEERVVSDADSLIEWIETVINRNDSSHQHPPYMADLSRQVRNFYYNCEMEDSLSIKDVLKSIMSMSDLLKEKYSEPYNSSNFDNIRWWQPNGKGGARNPYKILVESGDSPIHRGTEAMVVYGKVIAQRMKGERLNAYKKALLKYCELDTLAMLMIYQHWQNRMYEEK